MNDKETHKYFFQGVRWIPIRHDFIFDEHTIVAETSKKAWDLLDKQTNIGTWKSVSLISIDNVYYYEGV